MWLALAHLLISDKTQLKFLDILKRNLVGNYICISTIYIMYLDPYAALFWNCVVLVLPAAVGTGMPGYCSCCVAPMLP